MKLTRLMLEESFPTLVRYGGFFLVFIITGMLASGLPVAVSSGYVPAAGMIVFKTLREAAEVEEEK